MAPIRICCDSEGSNERETIFSIGAVDVCGSFNLECAATFQVTSG